MNKNQIYICRATSGLFTTPTNCRRGGEWPSVSARPNARGARPLQPEAGRPTGAVRHLFLQAPPLLQFSHYSSLQTRPLPLQGNRCKRWTASVKSPLSGPGALSSAEAPGNKNPSKKTRKSPTSCPNSVGQLCSSATKLTPHCCSLLRHGTPLDPSETPENIRDPRLRRPNLSLFSDQRRPFGNPQLCRKVPGPNPAFFRKAKHQIITFN